MTYDKGPLPIDFRSHSHLGWTHYRILLGIKDNIKRNFYFEQAAHARWSTRELQRKIDGRSSSIIKYSVELLSKIG